ncbi:MAG: exodeoxyribonuclease VII small subunit [Eubacteriales bacterium]
MENNPNKEPNFEEALARLEQIVRALESGSAPLDESLSLFEEGVGLVRLCNSKLADAEQKIKILVTTDQGIEERDFQKSDQK